VDAGMGGAALRHEAQRRLAVAVRGSDLAWHDELDAGIEEPGFPGMSTRRSASLAVTRVPASIM
jgi:hypothetical protein